MASGISTRARRCAQAAVGVGVVGLAAGFLGPAALATQGTSALLVSDSSTLTQGVTTDAVTLDLSAGPTSTTVYVGLDSSCPNAFVDPAGHGQQYAVTTTFNPTGVASVGPTDVSSLVCSSVTSFTITAVAPGVTTLSFFPVAANHGLQKKLSGPATVTVTVIGSTAGCPADPSACPPLAGTNPAAPAVANLIFNMPDTTAIKACQATFSGKNWRGSAISGVAAVMPKPESVKDTLSFAAWEQQVYDMLATVCHYSPETVS